MSRFITCHSRQSPTACW